MYRGVKAHAGGIVMLVTHNEDGVEFRGSAFLCHSKGYALTAAHQVDLMAKLAVAPSQPIDEFVPATLTRVHAHPVTVAQFDAVNDVALLKLPENVSVTVADHWVGQGERIVVGASVAALGVPFGNRGLHTVKLTGTLISGKSLTDQGSKRLHLDANVHEGNSGGSVVEVATGRIVGVVSGRFSPVGSGAGISIGGFALGSDSTISFAVPIEYGVALMRAEGLDV